MSAVANAVQQRDGDDTPTLVPILSGAVLVGDVITMLLGSTDATCQEPTFATKKFKADGSKQHRQPNFAAAIQIHVPDVKMMAALLKFAGGSPSAALCATRFLDLPVYSFDAINAALKHRKPRGLLLEFGFRIAPKAYLAKTYGAGSGIHRPKGEIPIVARLSENTQPSAWLLFDRDIDPGAPDWAVAAAQDNCHWLGLLDQYVPGLNEAPRVETASSSSRILRADGTPLSDSRGHVWVLQAAAPTRDALAEARGALRGRLIAEGATWTKPNKTGRPQICTPVDLAVWTNVPMAYSGKPTVEDGSGLTVTSPYVTIVEGTQPLDLSRIVGPTPKALADGYRASLPGVKVSVSGTGARMRCDIYDLELTEMVELPDGSRMTVAELQTNLRARRERGETDIKQRIQSPLRPDSRSIAAWAGLSATGELYICDFGLDGETHWLWRDLAADFEVLTEASAESALDSYYAYLPGHQFLHRPTRTFWPGASVDGHHPGRIDGLRPSQWLDRNRAVQQATWHPAYGEIMRDVVVADGGFVPQLGVLVYNKYRPPILIPSGADASPWLEHLRRIYPTDANHLIKWFAHRLQYPGEKVNHALVLGDSQGIGRHDPRATPPRCGSVELVRRRPEEAHGTVQSVRRVRGLADQRSARPGRHGSILLLRSLEDLHRCTTGHSDVQLQAHSGISSGKRTLKKQQADHWLHLLLGVLDLQHAGEKPAPIESFVTRRPDGSLAPVVKADDGEWRFVEEDANPTSR